MSTYRPPNVNENIRESYNQTRSSPQDIEDIKKSLKSSSKNITCPFCRNNGTTRIEQSCSICNLACCVLTVGLPWLIFQLARGKDINCYDVEHYCVRCGNKLASYRSC